MTEELNGTTKKFNACAIKANTQEKQANEANVLIGINSVEKILATRFPAERFNDLFNALKTLNRSQATDDDVKKALVSWHENIFFVCVLNKMEDNFSYLKHFLHFHCHRNTSMDRKISMGF